MSQDLRSHPLSNTFFEGVDHMIIIVEIGSNVFVQPLAIWPISKGQ